MTKHLLPLIETLANHRVLCVGDVMLDRFVYGQVERISPEAPIPVLRIQREAVTLGGGGNVARNVAALGGQADMVGIVGQDAAGYDLANQFAALGDVASYLITDKTRPTTLKTRYIADSQQLLRADMEVSSRISPDMERQVLLRVSGAMEHCDIVIVSDYAKGMLTDEVIAEIVKLGREKNRRILVDPKGRDFSRYRGAFMLTPNRRELTEATDVKICSVDKAEVAARQLIADFDLGGVLAKLGSDGVCLVMKGLPARHFRTFAREVYDVSGAGDTVMATLALALAGGMSAEDSAELANIAGSLVVGKIGTAVITREELAQELVRDEARSGEKKRLTREEAAATAERWRKQGLKVGFTNGVFDLLHPGHLSLIRQARAACDKLIVGLNSDASVKRLKGEGRPVHDESARAAVLSSLADVDGVAIFSEDTPLELIKAIRPAVLVKGADYTLDKVVGGDLVQGWGGQVILAQLVEGQSTTATIARLRG